MIGGRDVLRSGRWEVSTSLWHWLIQTNGKGGREGHDYSREARKSQLMMVRSEPRGAKKSLEGIIQNSQEKRKGSLTQNESN